MKKFLITFMAVMLCMCSSITCFAASPNDTAEYAIDPNKVYYTMSPIPSLPDIPTLDNYGSIIYDRNGTIYICIMYNNPDYSASSAKEVTIDGSEIVIARKDGLPFDVGLYKLNGDEWEVESLQTPPMFTLFNANNVLYTDFNIYDNEDNLVFQQAPQLVHQKLTGAVPHLVVHPMMKTLAILVPCGIGLLVLLVGLQILPRVLRRFLN